MSIEKTIALAAIAYLLLRAYQAHQAQASAGSLLYVNGQPGCVSCTGQVI